MSIQYEGQPQRFRSRITARCVFGDVTIEEYGETYEESREQLLEQLLALQAALSTAITEIQSTPAPETQFDD